MAICGHINGRTCVRFLAELFYRASAPAGGESVYVQDCVHAGFNIHHIFYLVFAPNWIMRNAQDSPLMVVLRLALGAISSVLMRQAAEFLPQRRANNRQILRPQQLGKEEYIAAHTFLTLRGFLSWSPCMRSLTRRIQQSIPFPWPDVARAASWYSGEISSTAEGSQNPSRRRKET